MCRLESKVVPQCLTRADADHSPVDILGEEETAGMALEAAIFYWVLNGGPDSSGMPTLAAEGAKEGSAEREDESIASPTPPSPAAVANALTPPASLNPKPKVCEV